MPNPRKIGGLAFDPDCDIPKTLIDLLSYPVVFAPELVLGVFAAVLVVFAAGLEGGGEAEEDDEEELDELLPLPCPSPLPVSPLFLFVESRTAFKSRSSSLSCDCEGLTLFVFDSPLASCSSLARL